MTAGAATNNDWRTKSATQTRLAFGQALLALGAIDPDVVVLSADTQDLLGIREYIELYPDRFIECGIAEQDKVRNDVAYAHQNVVIGAAASGISLGVSGGTHHAVEDLATMRSFAGLTVIVPADVDEA